MKSRNSHHLGKGYGTVIWIDIEPMWSGGIQTSLAKPICGGGSPMDIGNKRALLRSFLTLMPFS
jgi:hypothetical protein